LSGIGNTTGISMMYIFVISLYMFTEAEWLEVWF